MANLGLNNPTARAASVAISIAQTALKRSGEAIGTGKKSPITSITDYILGSSLATEAAILESVLKGTTYGTNLLNVAMNHLESMHSSLEAQLKIVVEADTPGAQQLEKLQTRFASLIDAVTRIAKNASFDSRLLLDGSLGGNSTVKNAFATVGVAQKTSPAALGNVFGAVGAKANSTIALAGGPTVGHKVVVNGVTFTWIGANAAPTTPYQVSVGAADVNAAENLAFAIANAPDLALKHLTATVDPALHSRVLLSNLSHSNVILDISSNDGTAALGAAANAVVVNNAGNAANPLTLTGVSSSKFIGNLTPNFAAVRVATAAAADALAQSYGIINSPDADAGNRAAEFTCVIGSETYKGALSTATNGLNNLNTARLKMTSDTGSTFTVNFDAAYAGSINAAGNATAIAGQINTLFAGSTFSQTQYLEIDNSAGNIIAGSNVIGTTTGLVATLDTTNFSNLTFEDFSIKYNAANSVDFTAKIGGKTFTAAAVDPATLFKGFKLDLTDAGGSGDVFSLTLGEHGLTAMTNAAATEAVQEAFKTALGIGQGLSIRVGSSFDDTINVDISNVTAKSLYLDNKGAYVANLDITNSAGAKIADEVVKNALNTISGIIASVGSQISNLELAAESVEDSRLVQQDAADDYIGTDYEAEVSHYTELLSRIQAAIATIIKSAAVAQAVLQLIQNG